jgi:hypothetical protein
VDAPANCGVPSATVLSVIRPDQPPNVTDDSCGWDRSNGPHRRSLTVKTTVVTGTDGGSPAGAAMGTFDDHKSAVPGTPAPVAGLGDEAYATYSRGSQYVSFRAGNVVSTVQLRFVEVGRATVRYAPEKDVRAEAFTVAAAVARALGATAVTPHLAAEPPSPPPITRRFSACDTVPRAVVKRFVPDQMGGPDDLVPPNLDSLMPHPVGSGCEWSSQTRTLKVRVEAATGGSATRGAAREYVRRDYEGRGRGWFQALRGPGEQAFSRYTSDDLVAEDTATNLGQVVFRVRNVLVTVWYGNDPLGRPGDEKLSIDAARNGAYAAAAQVARAVHV